MDRPVVIPQVYEALGRDEVEQVFVDSLWPFVEGTEHERREKATTALSLFRERLRPW